MKNLHPSHLIDKKIKIFLEKKFTDKKNTNIDHNNKSVFYYNILLYIGSYSNSTKKKNCELCKKFCKSTYVKIVFSTFNSRRYFLQKIVCQLL